MNENEPPRPSPWRRLMSLRYWLARLSFSFLILAGFFAYDAYKAAHHEGRFLPPWRIDLQYALAIVLLGLGLAGIRARHREGREDRWG